MKHFLIGLLLTTSVAYAQPPVIEWAPKSTNPASMPLDDTGEVRFQQIVQTPKLTKGQVIQRVSVWAAKFTGSSAIVATSDTTQGIIVIKGRLLLKHGVPLNHQLIVETKPGRYRVTVDDLAYQYEFVTPIKATKTYKLHSYGLSAQEWYDIYGTMGIQPGISLVGYKKMAVKSADNQDAILIDIKQRIGAMLDSLQKAVNTDSDW